MSQYLKFLIVVMFAVGLSACGSAARKAQPVTQSATGAEEIPAKQLDHEKTGSSEVSAESKEEELTALNYEIAPLQPEIDDDPEKLLGIDAQQLIEMLGEPTLIRSESPAEIWQYSTKSCVLDLVLYDSKTTYIEARDEEVRPMDNRLCLRTLLLSRENW
ncbi:MAG: hypothetical protein V7776_00245 [Halopseudomonas aestusnigri]